MHDILSSQLGQQAARIFNAAILYAYYTYTSYLLLVSGVGQGFKKKITFLIYIRIVILECWGWGEGGLERRGAYICVEIFHSPSVKI